MHSVARITGPAPEVDEYGYLSGYTPLRPSMLNCKEVISDLESQAQRLGDLLGMRLRIDADEVRARVRTSVPVWVEKFFVDVPWDLLGNTYGDAVGGVLELLEVQRGYVENKLGDRLGAEYLFPVPTANQLSRPRLGRSGVVSVIGAQLGLRYKGYSVEHARSCFVPNEEGLGVFRSGILLLLHQNRLLIEDDLMLDCAGDTYNDPQYGVKNSHVPFFGIQGGRLCLGAGRHDHVTLYSGSATFHAPTF